MSSNKSVSSTITFTAFLYLILSSHLSWAAPRPATGDTDLSSEAISQYKALSGGYLVEALVIGYLMARAGTNGDDPLSLMSRTTSDGWQDGNFA